MANGVELATAWVRLVPSLEGVQGSIATGLTPALAKEGTAAGKAMGASMKKAIGAAAIVAGVVAAFKGLYEVGATFDDVADTIRTGTGATGKALQGLIKDAKEVGKSVPTSFEKAGTTVADLNTRLGLSGKVLQNVASQYLEAGRILGEDVDIQKSSAAFNAFKISGDKVAGAMDTVFQVSQATGVGMNDLFTTISNNAPTLQNLGFSFQDSAAFIGTMDKAGINATKMTASMSAGLVQLAKTGEEPADAFKRVTKELQGYVESGDTATALDVAGKIFGTRGASQFIGALQSGKLNMDDLMAATGATGDTILGVGAETQDFSEKWQITMNKALAAIEPLASVIFNGLGQAMDAIMPKVEAFSKWLVDNPETIKNIAIGVGLLAGAIGAGAIAFQVMNAATTVAAAGGLAKWFAATKLATVTQGAFNLVMNANPIMLIVTAIGLLVAGLIYFFTQTELGKAIWEEFTRFLGEAWTNITGFFTAAWENVIQPVFQAIGEIATWLWESIISPVFAAIGAVVEWLAGAFKLGFDLIVNAFRLVGAIANWLWTNAIQPAFKFIGDLATWLWKTILEPYFKAWGALFQWLYQNIIKPVADAIGAAIKVLGDVFTWLYQNIIKPVWEGISTVISTAWNWIDDNIFTPFKTGIGLIGTAFENVAKAIGTAWNGIKKAAAVPINFVLDTVWNNGLRSFWNDMVGTLGLGDMKLPKAALVKFANGGVENHVAQIARGGAMRLWAEPETGGEAYIPLAKSKRGRSTAILQQVANQFGMGLTPYADGGFWGDIGNFAGDVWDNVSNAANVAWEFLSNPGAAIQKHVIDGIINPLLGGAGDSVFGRAVGQLPIKLVKDLAKLFPEPSSKGGAGMGWQAMWNVVKAGLPGAVLTSSTRPGATVAGSSSQSYHALGRAIDVVPGNMQTFNALAGMFPNASELIYTPAGNRQLLNGKPFNGWSDIVRSMHSNHVHLAMANGGILPGLMNGGTVTRAGYTVVGERGPELLRLPEGAQVNPDFDDLPGLDGVTFNNYAPIGQSPEQALTQFANRAKGL